MKEVLKWKAGLMNQGKYRQQFKGGLADLKALNIVVEEDGCWHPLNLCR
jgi:hypothetical protein